jgi:hypothetical protein
MLSTINGFDLLLILIITALAYRVYNLNRECEDYVGQMLRLSWDLQAELQANHHNDPDKHEYQSFCDCNKCIPF